MPFVFYLASKYSNKEKVNRPFDFEERAMARHQETVIHLLVELKIFV